LSKRLISHFFGATAVNMYAGREDKTTFNSFNLRDLFKNLPFQAGNLFANLSISGW
jgi:hypothetical protein